MLQDVEVIRSRIVRAAEDMRGTMYAHQHRYCRGPRRTWKVDCVGYSICVGRNSEVMDWDEEDSWWVKHRNYGRGPIPTIMMEGLDRFLHRLPRHIYDVADVVLFMDHGRARHLGIVTGSGSILHASVSDHKVVPYSLTPHVIGFIKAAWRYPGLQEALDGC